MRTMSLFEPLPVILGVLDELEGGIGDEGFPFGAWLWGRASLEDVLHLLNEEIGMGVNVNLPWWKLHCLEFPGDFPLNFDMFEGMLAKEDLPLGRLILVDGKESDLGGGDNVIIFGLCGVDVFAVFVPFERGLGGGIVEFGIGVGVENGVNEAVFNENVIDPPLFA